LRRVRGWVLDYSISTKPWQDEPRQVEMIEIRTCSSGAMSRCKDVVYYGLALPVAQSNRENRWGLKSRCEMSLIEVYEPASRMEGSEMGDINGEGSCQWGFGVPANCESLESIACLPYSRHCDDCLCYSARIDTSTREVKKSAYDGCRCPISLAK
jgi:hypothetical protein